MRQDLLTIDDVSKQLNVPVKTLRQWVYRGLIPNLKLNGVVRFSPRSIDEWMAKHERTANGLELLNEAKKC